MSTTFHVLFVSGLDETAAHAAEGRAAAALQKNGLISELSEQRTDELKRVVSTYEVSPHVRRLYAKRRPDAYGIGDRVKSIVGPYANGWSLNLASEYGCPSCGTAFRYDSEARDFKAVAAQMQGAVIAFIDADNQSAISCPRCLAARQAYEWRSDVPPGFAHLAFEFWGFPPFNSDAIAIPGELFGYGEWRLDFPRLIQDATGHPVGWTMGRI